VRRDHLDAAVHPAGETLPGAYPPRAWAAFRYGWLLPWSARRRHRARWYAAIAAAVDLADGARRTSAVQRIRRWMGSATSTATRIYHSSLTSEAREEADTAYFMRHPHELATAFRPPLVEPPSTGPVIYVTLHFGSPVLAYLYLRARRGVDARLIARRLSPANPMAAAKRAFAEHMVAWVAAIAGHALLATDAGATARAREHLVDGASLFAAIDVPGDVVARAAEVTLFGEAIAVSSGLATLARLTGVPMQPVVAVSRGGGLHVRYGSRVPAGGEREMLDAVFDELSAFIAADPGEWWLWPYVVVPTPVRASA
jgi:lauroyl/myristoyl acyltransferase